MCHKVPDVIKELKRFAKKLVKGLDERMGPTKLVSQMAPFQVSYLKAQSKRSAFCAETYGADEIRALASQFSSIPGFDADAAIYEWPMLVRLLAARVKNFPTDDDSAAVDFWEPVLVEINGSPNYKNVIYLVELYVVAVALSVQCERYYSMISHTLGQYRTSFSVDTVDCILHVKCMFGSDGIELDHEVLNEIYEDWNSQKNRGKITLQLPGDPDGDVDTTRKSVAGKLRRVSVGAPDLGIPAKSIQPFSTM